MRRGCGAVAADRLRLVREEAMAAVDENLLAERSWNGMGGSAKAHGPNVTFWGSIPMLTAAPCARIGAAAYVSAEKYAL